MLPFSDYPECDALRHCYIQVVMASIMSSHKASPSIFTLHLKSQVFKKSDSELINLGLQLW